MTALAGAFHLAASLIPTVEREAVDFVDPHLGVWNRSLVMLAGVVARAGAACVPSTFSCCTPPCALFAASLL